MTAQGRYIVHDVDKAIEFYTGFLDFKLQQQFGPAMAILQRDDLIQGPGGRQMLCEDPSGNLVELFQPAKTSK